MPSLRSKRPPPPPTTRDTTNLTWTQLTGPEKGDRIRPYILDRQLTYSAIANILGVSRVAIAGAADRNGIKSPLAAGSTGKRGSAGATALMARTAPERAKAARERKAKPTPIKSNIRPIPTLPLGVDVTAEPVKADAWTPLPGTTPLPVAEHKDGMCAWPVEVGGKTLYCCAPTADKNSWCPAHRRMGYRPTPPLRLKKRTAA